MKRRNLICSALIALGIAGSAFAGGLHARWTARQAELPTAQTLHLDAQQTTTFNDLQARQRAFRSAAHAAIGDCGDCMSMRWGIWWFHCRSPQEPSRRS